MADFWEDKTMEFDEDYCDFHPTNGMTVFPYGVTYIDHTAPVKLDESIVERAVVIANRKTPTGDHIWNNWVRWRLPHNLTEVYGTSGWAPEDIKTMLNSDHVMKYAWFSTREGRRLIKALRYNCTRGIALMFEENPEDPMAGIFYHSVWYEVELDPIMSLVDVGARDRLNLPGLMQKLQDISDKEKTG